MKLTKKLVQSRMQGPWKGGFAIQKQEKLEREIYIHRLLHEVSYN